MFRRPDNIASDLCPVDRGVHLLIHQSANNHVVASDHVQSMAGFRRGFVIICGPDDALHRLLEHEVGHLVAGYQRAGQGSPVYCQDEDFLCKRGKEERVSRAEYVGWGGYGGGSALLFMYEFRDMVVVF